MTPFMFSQDAISFLLQHADYSAKQFVSITIPAPLFPLPWVLSVFQKHASALFPKETPLQENNLFFWDSPQGCRLVCLGQVKTYFPKTSQRFSEIQQQTQETIDAHQHISHPGYKAPPLLFVGGFSFSAGLHVLPPWQDFGTGFFFLPQWTYGQWENKAFFRLTLPPMNLQSNTTHLLEKEMLQQQILLLLTEGMEKPRNISFSQNPHQIKTISELPYLDWERYLLAILTDIQTGILQKSVAARFTRITLNYPLQLPAIFSYLAQKYPPAIRFGLQNQDSLFLGATPETLLCKQSNTIKTEALAGTIAAFPTNAKLTGQNRQQKQQQMKNQQAKILLQSMKDQKEHQFVVKHLREKLLPFCTKLTYPSQPSIKQSGSLLHLHTPFEGILKEPHSILSLVEKLHPTPAVGGIPVEKACSLIEEQEPCQRGLYAGPIGFFDEAGDGQFAVAIRSALIQNQQAFIYAGAGIVQGSDPKAEYQETQMKQQGMMEALQVQEEI